MFLHLWAKKAEDPLGTRSFCELDIRIQRCLDSLSKYGYKQARFTIAKLQTYTWYEENTEADVAVKISLRNTCSFVSIY